MIDKLGLIFVVLGILSFVFGYRKNHRNWMLVGAVFLTLSGSIVEFTYGFIEGWNGSTKAEHQ